MFDPAVHIKDMLSPPVVIDKATLGPLISSIMPVVLPSALQPFVCISKCGDSCELQQHLARKIPKALLHSDRLSHLFRFVFVVTLEHRHQSIPCPILCAVFL